MKPEFTRVNSREKTSSKSDISYTSKGPQVSIVAILHQEISQSLFSQKQWSSTTVTAITSLHKLFFFFFTESCEMGAFPGKTVKRENFSDGLRHSYDYSYGQNNCLLYKQKWAPLLPQNSTLKAFSRRLQETNISIFLLLHHSCKYTQVYARANTKLSVPLKEY